MSNNPQASAPPLISQNAQTIFDEFNNGNIESAKKLFNSATEQTARDVSNYYKILLGEQEASDFESSVMSSGVGKRKRLGGRYKTRKTKKSRKNKKRAYSRRR
jgi:hypothetical protein